MFLTPVVGGWQSRTRLLALGGGFDRGYLQSLGTAGQALIRAYVESGGAYLGICAGAYFGCSHIEFDKGGPQEVCGPRQLHFFPGMCIGPAFPGFQYDSERGAHAAKLSWTIPDPHGTKLLHCYFNGGGYFKYPQSHTQGQNCSGETLAKYVELPGTPAAVVRCIVGSGTAILSGVHCEYRGTDLDSEDPDLRNVIPLVTASETKRLLCVESLLEQLGLSKTAASKV